MIKEDPNEMYVEKAFNDRQRSEERKVRRAAAEYWVKHQELVGAMNQDEFMEDVWSCIFGNHQLSRMDDVKEYAKRWTDERQAALTGIRQEIDNSKSMDGAEVRWKRVLDHELFEAVEPVTLRNKAREIRAICLDREGIRNIVNRIWSCLIQKRYEQADVTKRVRKHLDMYMDTMYIILESIKYEMPKNVQGTVIQDDRDFLWRRLLAIEKVDKTSCDHLEHRIYRVWWESTCKGAESTIGHIELWRLAGFKIHKDSLRAWVAEQILRHTPGGQIPSRLRKMRLYLEPTPEQKRDVLERYLVDLDDLKDYAERWWTLVKEEALPFQGVAAELDRMRKTVKKQKELKVVVRSIAGRKNASMLQIEGEELHMEVGPLEIARCLGTLQVIGIERPRSLEREPEYMLRTCPEQENCMKALEDLEECRLFPKETWKAWDRAVRGEVAQEVEKVAEEGGPAFEEEFPEMRRSRTHDPKCRERVKIWLKAIRAKKERLEEQYEKERWKFGRLTIRRRDLLIVEVITNSPGKLHDWDIRQVEGRPKYQLKEIYHKARLKCTGSRRIARICACTGSRREN
jgi:hypothetical protein